MPFAFYTELSVYCLLHWVLCTRLEEFNNFTSSSSWCTHYYCPLLWYKQINIMFKPWKKKYTILIIFCTPKRIVQARWRNIFLPLFKIKIKSIPIKHLLRGVSSSSYAFWKSIFSLFSYSNELSLVKNSSLMVFLLIPRQKIAQ